MKSSKTSSVKKADQAMAKNKRLLTITRRTLNDAQTLRKTAQAARRHAKELCHE